MDYPSSSCNTICCYKISLTYKTVFSILINTNDSFYNRSSTIFERLISSESAQAIAEIAKLLKADPILKIHVVGHTDNVGDIDSNIKLSKDRGEAVLQALARDHGIAATRLKSYGCGQFAPVASNDTEEGRAKNRRVELVKQ